MLAAGAGRRYGGPKAPVVLDSERLVDRAVRVLRAGGCAPVLVVLGAWLGEVPDALTVHNDQWPEGMGSSLRSGLTALAASAADAVVVSLVDLPGLTPAAVASVVAAPGDLVAASYAGRRGHPVKIGRAHWAGVLAVARGDRGARAYLDAHLDRLELVEVGELADGEDLDVPR